MYGNQSPCNLANYAQPIASGDQHFGKLTHFESPSLRDRRQFCFSSYLAFSISLCFILLYLSGCSPKEVKTSIDSDSSETRSVQGIFAVYTEQGISGVSRAVLDCYDKAYKSQPSVRRQRQVQHCISIDWAGYQLDSWASAALKTTNIPFFHEDALNERVRAFLPLSGLTEKEVEDLTFAIDDLLKSEINEANK